MINFLNKTIWLIFAVLCILIGLYPIIYLLIDRHFGLLGQKSQEILTSQIWNIGFYGHIFLGGLALLIGWTQFSTKLRNKNMSLHRNIGKLYVICVLFSGVFGVFLAQYATGGITNVIGFSMSGIIWLATTLLAYTFIRKGQIERHQNFMIYSYALCFSAVTLRFWLMVLVPLTGNFITAYLWTGWISWIPNLLVAALIINRRKNIPVQNLA